MREGYADYYELEEGCCLLCPNSHPGCLCYGCNCTKCCWYEPQLAGNKPCEMVDILKEKSREKWIEMMKQRQKEENDLFKIKVEKYEVDKHKHLIDNKDIFVCQKCSIEFLLPSEFNCIIIEGEQPVCPFCLNKYAGEYQRWKENQKYK